MKWKRIKMGMWLNSADGINCHGCGKEVHTRKCYGKKGYISVEFNLAQRKMDGGRSTDDCTPLYVIEFCGIKCLKKAKWGKIYKDILRVEKNLMHYDYEAKKEKTGIE